MKTPKDFQVCTFSINRRAPWHNTNLKENQVKKNLMLALAALAIAIFPAVSRAYASQPLEGVISDSMCGRRHMATGKTPAQCVKECIRNNSHYVLVTKDKIYDLTGKLQAVTPFAGKRVRIEGAVARDTVKVEAVQEIKPEMPANMPM